MPLFSLSSGASRAPRKRERLPLLAAMRLCCLATCARVTDGSATSSSEPNLILHILRDDTRTIGTNDTDGGSTTSATAISARSSLSSLSTHSAYSLVVIVPLGSRLPGSSRCSAASALASAAAAAA